MTKIEEEIPSSSKNDVQSETKDEVKTESESKVSEIEEKKTEKSSGADIKPSPVKRYDHIIFIVKKMTKKSYLLLLIALLH